MKFRRIFFVFSLLILCLLVSVVLAEAPDTAKIVFVSTRDGNREIYIMNPDGTEKVRITQNFSEELYPSWSPTGEEILFVSDRDGVQDLYLMDADGSNVRRVFKKSARRVHPTWSPDGKRIAYVRGGFIYIATLGKQEEQQFVNGFHPAWSPDGTEIAFARGPFGSHRLTLVNVRTRRQKQVLPEDTISWQHEPAWSPTGEKIAFSWLNRVRPHGKLFDLVDKETIYIVNRDGTSIERIVPEAGKQATLPVWNPRGSSLIYEQMTDNSIQLFKINLASRTRTQLTRLGFGQGNTLSDWFDPVVLSVSPRAEQYTTLWGRLKRP
jgi:Tol biopolymer transport system component